jgi:hypothetical protein
MLIVKPSKFGIKPTFWVNYNTVIRKPELSLFWDSSPNPNHSSRSHPEHGVEPMDLRLAIKLDGRARQFPMALETKTERLCSWRS